MSQTIKNNSSQRDNERKALSFTTTLRNPERISSFLSVLKMFEGQVLDNSLIHEIVKEVLRRKLYSTMPQRRDARLKAILDDEESAYSDNDLEKIISISPQKHKEAGFDEGWPSRFQTWFAICREFGFANYAIGKQIQISQTGHILCEAYENFDDDNSSKKIQSVFLNTLVKYQTDNPYRRNANKNVPLLLLMNTINLLKNDQEENDAGISRREIPLVLCWPNNDANSLYTTIKKIRAEHKFSASDDFIYRYCLSLLESNNEKRWKKNQLIKEGPDDFLRKIRMTGIFSLRGMGRFVDFNQLEHDKISYILLEYGKHYDFLNTNEYYEYVGSMDPKIMTIKTDTKAYNLYDIKQTKLNEIATKYSKDSIKEELLNLEIGKHSSDEYFSDIDEPTRFEFLTSIALKQSLPNATIIPNYSIDDEGNPTFTARGGIGDIEVNDEKNNSIFEVTLMAGKTQATNEIPAITMHLKKVEENSDNKEVDIIVDSKVIDNKQYFEVCIEKIPYEIINNEINFAGFIFWVDTDTGECSLVAHDP